MAKGKKDQQAVKKQQKAEAKLKKAKKKIAALQEEVAALQETAATAIVKRDKAKSKRDEAREKAARWKAEAREERTRTAKVESRLRREGRQAPVDAEPPSERGDLPVEDGAPDATWTVTRLRAAAREKSVTGYSRMTKAQLLDALQA